MIETVVLCLIVFFIGVLIFFLRSNGDRASVHFRRILAYMTLWCVSIILTERDPERALLWSRLSFVFPLMMVLALDVFTSSFTSSVVKWKSEGKLIRAVVLGCYVIGVPLAVVSAFTPLVLTDVSADLVSSFGALQPYYGIFMIMNFCVVIGILTLAAKRAHGRTVAQLGLILAGITVSAAVAVTTNLILPFLGLGEIRSLGPLALIFFLGCTVYAMVAHRLFDIRVVVKRTVIFTVLVIFAFVVYTVVIVLATQLFQGRSQSTTPESFVANLLAAMLIGFSFEPLRRWLSDRTDAWLFKKEYEQQAVVKQLADKLNDVIGLDEALEIMMQTVTKVLHLKHAVTYVFQPAENQEVAVKRIKQIGYGASARLLLEDRDFTVKYFTDNSKILLTSELEIELEQERQLIERGKLEGDAVRAHAIRQAVAKKLRSLDVAIAVPLHLNGQPIGLIFLSEKLSDDAYRPQDIALLELTGAQAISSIQKAKLYEGDQMKSEFVSIASHELLTPISAIEGYLSMILEENIGHVDPQAKEYLGKVYTSAKRLSALVKDLLSVSRIESGKMKVVQQQLDTDKAINDVIDQLRFLAQQKNLELIYHKPYEALPPVWADPDRTSQILVNLVSNSIKYTPTGSVTITPKLDKKNGLVSISIADTGMGMSKQAVSHLFTKFYRVDTPDTAGIGGTGLGLYITKSLIEKMGGNIVVKSVEGKGSTFTFTLPVFRVESSTIE